jgi:tRNA A-37 threonylcarbamoyl transferase component Bud32
VSDETRTCARCGATIPSAAAEGSCPRCLLAAASVPTDAADATRSGSRPPPELARIAEAFPHLEITELIGAGGMGAVYKARQPRLDRWVALKVLPDHLAKDPAFAERFLREARVLARLSHPGIVTVHDFGESGGHYYLLMEFVDGVNLRQAMRAAAFTPAQALSLAAQICEALQFAHANGVMHRDIKPENVLIDAKGRVKIADFGIARILGETSSEPRLTASGAAIGTPQYMAPEQIERPDEVDHRADIYAVGVVIYELLTGELPLGRFAPPSAKTPVDARVDEIVMRALAKERELRQQSARELKTEVETASAGLGVKSGARRAAEAGPSVVESLEAGLIAGPARFLVTVFLLVLFGFLLWFTAPVFMAPIAWSISQFREGGLRAAWALPVWFLAGAGLWFYWRRRKDFVALLRGAPGGKGGHWLRLGVAGVLACVGMQICGYFLISLLGIAISASQGGGVTQITGASAMFLGTAGAPVLFLVRERMRKSVVPPAPAPRWMNRQGLTLAAVAALSELPWDIIMSSGLGWNRIAVNSGAFLLVTAVALFTRDRRWRAAALGFNTFFAVVECVVMGNQAIRLGVAVSSGDVSGVLEILSDPWHALILRSWLWVFFIAGLISLLAPGARAAFGLPRWKWASRPALRAAGRAELA